jgi:hypothetical protein
MRYAAPMAHLHDQTSVECPVAETQSRLEAYFASLRAADGVVRLRLRVPMSCSPTSPGLSLDREVRVEARRARDESNLNDVIRIAWTPEGSVVFPKFEGTLVVLGGEDPNLSYIELDGTYVPPLGTAGEVFDAAIGHQIAQSTARQFLKDLKRASSASDPKGGH